MRDECNERFFEELAKAYAENEGMTLKSEFVQIENTASANELSHYSLRLDKKIKRAAARHRIKSYCMKALPFAASVVIAVLSYNVYKLAFHRTGADSEYSASEPAITELTKSIVSAETKEALRYSVELVSAVLPIGYEVTAVDYDNAAAVMEITNDEKNRIVLMTEEYHDFNKEGFSEITINGVAAHGLIKNDYCILKYGKDDMLYTFTSMYGFGDLIKISENFL